MSTITTHVFPYNFRFFVFFFVFCYLILRGDPLSQRLFFRGPTELLRVHTTQSQVITIIKSIHTHTVWSVAALFFQAIQGCRAGLNPEHPITLAQHHHQTATEPPLHLQFCLLVFTTWHISGSTLILNMILSHKKMEWTTFTPQKFRYMYFEHVSLLIANSKKVHETSPSPSYYGKC